MDNNEMNHQSTAAENTAQNEKKDKKKLIIVVAVIIAIVAGGIVAALLVSHHQKNNPDAVDVGAGYVVVTDENGEPVTDENGNVVTVQASTDANGQAYVTTPDGSKVTATTLAPKADNGGNGSGGKETIKKPDAPEAVSGVKVSDATEDSLTVSWNKVKCDGYQVSYSEDNISWTNYPTDLNTLYTSTSLKLSGLKPYTRYYFSVRAYNINEAGASASAWSGTVYGDTLEVKESREITVSVKLPYDSGLRDTLEIWVDDELAFSGDVLLNGTEFTVTLDKKYKGVVTVWAGLKDEDVSTQVNCGGYDASLDLSAIGIDVVAEDEF